MRDQDEMSFCQENFSGRVRLFPLPDLVLFPGVIQPLHIFEPRYRNLVADALAGDRLIASALLEPGWESDYDGRPPVASIACLGKIVTHKRLDDGRYHLLLSGLVRTRLTRELAPRRTYREARVEVLNDEYSDCSAMDMDDLQQQLICAFQQMHPLPPAADDLLHAPLDRQISLGTLTDIIGYSIDFKLAVKQQLLAETSVACRAKYLIKQLRAMGASPVCHPASLGGFPPGFSPN